MSDPKFAAAVAITAAKLHMSRAEHEIVSSALQWHLDKMYRELSKHIGQEIDALEWAKIVVAAAYKALGREPPQLEPHITCPRCQLTSYNANDIQQRYCGNCHMRHDDEIITS